MSHDGTPLRKRGRFQVFRVKNRTHPYLEIRDIVDDSFVGSTGVKASADHCVECLALGLPMATPQEDRDWTMELYAGTHPTKFRYYMRRFLGGGTWRNGGVFNDDVTDYAPEGREARKQRAVETKAEARQGLDPDLYPDRTVREDEMILQSYADGTWPDADEPDDPSPEVASSDYYTPPNSLVFYQDSDDNPRSPMGQLASAKGVPDARPEWVEAARVAMQLALRHGVDDPKQNPMLPTLRRWAQILTERYGGDWYPDLNAPYLLRRDPNKELEAWVKSVLQTP